MRRSIRRAPTASRKCSNASRPQWASAGSPRATDVPVRARCSAGVSRVEATFWLSTGASSPGSASSKGGSSKARCHSLSRVTSPRGGSRTRSSAGALGCSMVRAGLVSPKHRSHAGYVVLETGVTQQSDGEVPEVLSRFRDAVAQGKVYGPYAGNSGENVYRWKACGLDEIAATLHALAPRVATVKRSQAQRALDVFSRSHPFREGIRLGVRTRRTALMATRTRARESVLTRLARGVDRSGVHRSSVSSAYAIKPGFAVQ